MEGHREVIGFVINLDIAEANHFPGPFHPRPSRTNGSPFCSSWRWACELVWPHFEPPVIGMLSLASLAGSSLGSLVLLGTPNSTFSGLVPWLLLGGTAVFSGAPWIRRKGGAIPAHRSTAALIIGQFVIAVYGGYF